MKCFECGSKCITNYIYHTEEPETVIAVNKICEACGWFSHPTKVPEAI